MARLLAIDSCTVSLRNALLGSLRAEDEGLLLPQAGQSIESNVFKNCVFRLDGSTPNVNPAVLSPDLFSGISLIQLKANDVKRIEAALDNDAERKRLLAALTAAIPSELSDPSLQVGPSLDCDDDERDKTDSTWECGLDSSSSFVGLFSAEHSRVPEGGVRGQERCFKQWYLVCKAGAGVAASTFHARLVSALSKGASLDAALGEGGVVGSKALLRLASSASRNRQRILLAAKEALGLIAVESVGDQASRNKYRGAVAEVDVVVNTLRKLDGETKSTWQLCNAVDGVLSKGLMALSNAAEGLLLFLHSSGDKRVSLKNECWAAVPFATTRLKTGRSMVDVVSKTRQHIDEAWIVKRFAWKNRQFEASQASVIPFSLWGSHEPETFTKTFSRELGLADLSTIRLRPEVVCIGGVESGKLRALLG